MKLMMKHALYGGEVPADIDDRAYEALGSSDAHIRPDALFETAVDGEIVVRERRGIADDLGLHDLIFQERSAGVGS